MPQGWQLSVGVGQTVSVVRTNSSCVHGAPDGRAIVFETAAQLTTDDDDSASDIYLYDAIQDHLVRLTAPDDPNLAYVCTLAGERCNGDLGFEFNFASSEAIGLNGAQHVNVAVMDVAGEDVVSVFFESRVPLVPEDSNERMDVYEWQSGALRLISPGNSDDDAFFSGNSLDGQDVFFQTAKRIDPREIDEDYDIYDARIGGGFPYELPPVPCDTLADKCQGSGSFEVTGGDVTSNAGGDGDATPPPRVGLIVRRFTASARRRAARTGVLRVEVKASRPGKVRARARARLGGRLRQVGEGSVTLAKAGRAVLRVRLSAVARKRLRHRRSLLLKLEVSAAGALTRDVEVTLFRRAGR
jgi:hypothetical protein